MQQSPFADFRRPPPDGASGNLTYSVRTSRHGHVQPPRPRLVPEPTSRPIHSTSRDRAPNRDFGPSLFERLSRRKLVHWIVAYLAGAWLLLQLTDVLSEIWAWPITLQRAVSLVLGMGLFPAIVVAWFHGEKGHQRVCLLEVAVVGTLVACASAVVWYFCGGPSA